MSNAMEFLNKFNTSLSKVFFPLTEFEDEEDIQVLFREIGIDISSAPTLFVDLAALIGEIANIVDDFENSDENTDNQELYKSVFEIIINSIKTIKSLSEEAENLSSFSASDIFKNLLDYLLCHHLQEEIPILYEVFILCGIIEATEKTLVVGGEEHAYQERKVEYSGALALVTDPLQRLKEIYGWDSDNVNMPLLIDRVSNLLAACDVISDFDAIPSNINSVLGANTKSFDINNFTDYSGTVLETKIPLGEGLGDFTIQVYSLYSADGTKCDGFAVGMDYSGEINISIPLSDNLQINLTTNASVNNGTGMAFRKNSPVAFYQNLLTDDGSQLPGSSDFSFLVDLAYENEDERIMLLGCSNGSSLSIDSAKLSIGVLKSTSKPLDIFIELQFSNCEIVITARDSDSFISKLLGDEEIKAIFDFGIGWSSLTGIYFSGSAALDVTIPLHAKLGPILIESIFLRVQLDGEIVDISVAGSFGAELGPINASINRIGLIVPFTFPPQMNGNLGPVDIQTPRFLPPIGAGLVIDTGAIVGGGYLEIDSENYRYAGILQLNASAVGLVAIGLITTRMPDGSEGFSLLINIGVEFMPPIQLPYGFTLSGVGGLLGYNRTMKTDVLRDGLRNRALDSILFPEDPIANAPKIISDLRAVFPPEEGRFVIGPMIKLGWGTPKNIIHADIGIFIELPLPIRIALLGQIAATLPTPDQTIIELHIDVLGIIEFDKQLLSIDATIYDSRIYEYTLTGDAALRLSWGDTPVFAMSLGGFHPRFSPPPNFPSLRRLTLNLSQGSAIQLYCKTYQALTSNSLQFGARVDLFAKESGATVEGNLTFDTLIYFSPFSFVAAMSGNVVARYKGHKLSSVYISLNLSGPTPWNARGKASFEILFWDVDVEFNKTWGPLEAITIAAVNAWPELKKALEANDSWGSKLPGRNGMVEMLAEIEEDGASPPLVLHPAGFLEIRQKVLPLGIRLDKLGNAPVKDHNWFEITNIIIGSEELDLSPVEEDFARGQFINLSDSEKLSRPSFEKMKAGVAASSDRLSFEKNEYTALTYESILIQEDRTSKEADHKDKATLDWRVAKRQLFGNAARRSGLRTTGRRKFETLGKAKHIGVVNDGYTLVNNADMSKVVVSGNDGAISQLQAEQLLNNYLQSNPDKAEEIAIVPSFEVAA